jgi:hypothetical protein
MRSAGIGPGRMQQRTLQRVRDVVVPEDILKAPIPLRDKIAVWQPTGAARFEDVRNKSRQLTVLVDRLLAELQIDPEVRQQVTVALPSTIFGANGCFQRAVTTVYAPAQVTTQLLQRADAHTATLKLNDGTVANMAIGDRPFVRVRSSGWPDHWQQQQVWRTLEASGATVLAVDPECMPGTSLPMVGKYLFTAVLPARKGVDAMRLTDEKGSMVAMVHFASVHSVPTWQPLLLPTAAAVAVGGRRAGAAPTGRVGASQMFGAASANRAATLDQWVLPAVARHKEHHTPQQQQQPQQQQRPIQQQQRPVQQLLRRPVQQLQQRPVQQQPASVQQQQPPQIQQQQQPPVQQQQQPVQQPEQQLQQRPVRTRPPKRRQPPTPTNMQLRSRTAPSVTKAQAAATYAAAVRGGSAVQLSNPYELLGEERPQQHGQQQQQQQKRSKQPRQLQGAIQQQPQPMEVEGAVLEATGVEQQQQQQQQMAVPMQQQPTLEGAAEPMEQAEPAMQQQQQPTMPLDRSSSSSSSGNMLDSAAADAWLSQLHQAVEQILGEEEEALSKVKWGVLHTAFLNSPCVAGCHTVPNDGVAANGAVCKWAKRWLCTHGFSIPTY